MYKVSPEMLLRMALEAFDVANITRDKVKATEEIKIRISKVLEIPVNILFNK